ncbi:PD40 domain-containing protein [Geobacter hydrogenophilus]|uniref:TolB protein n=1 Tax=Geobacter hydrogenophilus TaxID=40983 RepID=A0A9W6G410_9BACT|nr:PD40 domain-containing protein [Geobacter hydrogenophilus]MBT0892572.1 PD40 domain-containing protein [Geobacter hydrogenophilus]GLI39969.1 hypothetical protein GHYDROH2_34700 [Geobacter hydrogenophilus]
MSPILKTSIVTLLATVSLSYGADAATTVEKVLFVSNRDGNAQIYIMNADGSGQRPLTRPPEENTEPAWSPDGSRIAFTSYRDGNAEIYVMDADGTNQKRLTSDKFSDNAPTWTPDGRVIFRSNRDRWTNFYVMAADGTGLKQLTTTPVDKGTPVLSPDGGWIAFVVHGETGSSEIHVMPAAGGVAKNLTGSLSKNKKMTPSWSPDSKRLVYTEAKDLALNIRAIDPDGGNPGTVTDNVYSNAFPAWAPDGKRIAFVSSREGTRTEMARGDIYVMNADGTGTTNLTHNPDEDNYPAWSADSRTIYFVSLRNGTAQIFSVPAGGGEQRRLTNNKGHDVMIRPQTLAAPSPRPETAKDTITADQSPAH